MNAIFASGLRMRKWSPISRAARSAAIASCPCTFTRSRPSSVTEKMRKVATPNRTRCEDVAKLLGVPIEKTVKAIAVIREEARDGASGSFAMLHVRRDDDLNEVKTQKVIGAFRFARDEEIERTLKCGPGYIGPVTNATFTIYVDRAVAVMSDFVCGANEAGYHLTGVNWGRDLPEPQPQLTGDIRKVVAGDPSPDGKGALEIVRGIGNTGIVAAATEQNHDEHGIVFPQPIAPFHVALVPIGYGKNAAVRDAADSIYRALTDAGFEVLLETGIGERAIDRIGGIAD